MLPEYGMQDTVEVILGVSDTANQWRLYKELTNIQNAQHEIPLSVVSSVLYCIYWQFWLVFKRVIDIYTKL